MVVDKIVPVVPTIPDNDTLVVVMTLSEISQVVTEVLTSLDLVLVDKLVQGDALSKDVRVVVREPLEIARVMNL